MEGIKREAQEEEQVDDYIDQLELPLKGDITLYQPELLAIYICIHWVWKSKDTRWNEVEIEEMIGHAMLRLDVDKYQKLDLNDLLKDFRDENAEVTKAVKVRAESIKKVFLEKIFKLNEKAESSPSLVTFS